MANWERQIGAMTLHVSDVARAREFYQRAFGLEGQQLDTDTVMIKFTGQYVFLHQDPAHQPPGGVVEEQGKSGAGQFAIIVEDVDAVRAELDANGVTLASGPEDRAWGMRTITFADPDGYVWEIAQPLS
jgi:catechol 2,3-dioxygenase-like lactoylglutathione lyase family enzyme